MSIFAKLPPLSLSNGPWIAGGAALHLYKYNTLAGVKDLDFYFTCEEQFEDFEYELKYKLKAEQLQEHRQTKNSSNRGYTIKNDYKVTQYLYDDIIFDLVTMIYPETVEKCFDTFDFNIVCFATDGKMITHTFAALQDFQNKEINFNKTDTTKRNSVDKMYNRICKYVDKGYMPTAVALLRAEKVYGKDFTDRVLKYLDEKK